MMRYWSKEEEDIVKELWPNVEKIKEKIPHRTKSAIETRAWKLSLPPKSVYDMTTEELDLELESKVFLGTFLDTDGTIGISESNSGSGGASYSPYVSLFSTKRKLVNKAAEILGEIGNVYHQDGQKEKWDSVHTLQIGKMSEIVGLLKAVLPYLTVKRKQAELVIQYCEKRIKQLKEGRKAITDELMEIAEEVRQLNRRGVPT